MEILLSSNKNIIKKYVKENSKIGFVPTASEIDQDRWYMEKDKKDLREMNYEIIVIDITKESKKEIVTKLANLDALFIAGGNCFYLLQQIKEKDLLKELIEFANHKIYIGSSAGSCLASPSIAYVEKLDDKTKAPLLKDYDSLNLIDVYILPHYQSDEEKTHLIEQTMEKYKDLNFLTLTNEQAVIVNDRKKYKVVSTD